MYAFPLPHAVVLLVSGRDAPRYLNARLTNDVKGLPEGGCCLAAALSPQGKTEAFFEVARLSDDQFLLVCDGGSRDQVITAFKRFIVADRVLVDDQSDAMAVWHIAGAQGSLPPDGRSLVRQDNRFGFPRVRGRTPGMDLVTPRDTDLSTLLEGGIPVLNLDERAYERIVAFRPEFPTELNADHLFAESGLKEAISFTKGCYVGQEVVEKLDALGRKPRELTRARLAGHSAPAEGGEAVRSGEEGTAAIGEVLSVGRNERHDETICFLSLRGSVERGSTVWIGSTRGEIF